MKISDILFVFFLISAGAFVVALEVFIGTLIPHDFWTILFYGLVVSMIDFIILAVLTLQ